MTYGLSESPCRHRWRSRCLAACLQRQQLLGLCKRHWPVYAPAARINKSIINGWLFTTSHARTSNRTVISGARGRIVRFVHPLPTLAKARKKNVRLWCVFICVYIRQHIHMSSYCALVLYVCCRRLSKFGAIWWLIRPPRRFGTGPAQSRYHTSHVCCQTLVLTRHRHCDYKYVCCICFLLHKYSLSYLFVAI